MSTDYTIQIYYVLLDSTNIQKLAHIRMDFRGIMQSAWTRKG